jgi:hypothetical protein
MDRLVRASVCQRISMRMRLSRLESVTSLINQRNSCLRCAHVVVEASKTRGQILRKLTDLLALCCREQQGGRLWPALIVPLQPLDLQQLLIPLAFQAARHQSVVRIDRPIAPTSQVGRILGPFNLPPRRLDRAAWRALPGGPGPRARCPTEPVRWLAESTARRPDRCAPHAGFDRFSPPIAYAPGCIPRSTRSRLVDSAPSCGAHRSHSARCLARVRALRGPHLAGRRLWYFDCRSTAAAGDKIGPN